ncbi:MAG: ABC transporter permease [Terracidiphilus sp.]
MPLSLMDLLRMLISRSAAFLRHRAMDADLDEELRAHIELAIAQNTRRGMSEEDSRTAAMRAFGGITQTRENYRVQRGFTVLLQFARDLRFASRQLRRSPGFALTVVLTLALGIGAVTSVFSVVDAVLLKPFAFPDPQRLVVVREVVEEMRSQGATEPDNYRHYLRLKQDAKMIEDPAIFQTPGLSVSPTGDHPRIVGGVKTSPNLFRVLGVQPIIGRDFVANDARKGSEHVVVLSYEAWRTFFAGDLSAIGKTMRVGGDPYIVIGVLPREMQLPHFPLAPNIAFQESTAARETMIYEPLAPSDWDLKTDTGNFDYRVIARLKRGATLAQASAELETLQRSYSISAHLPIHLGISLTPLARDVTAGIGGALWLMFAAIVGGC